jgi:hypothetical protein
MKTRRFQIALSLLNSIVCSGLVVSADDAVNYNRDIRPILSDTCYKCHGPDEAERKADLRLNIEEGAIAKRDGGAAVVRGKSQESVLYQRISSTDPDTRMPPVDSGKSLTAEQIELIKRWIDQGAEWQGHWSFIKPQRRELPATQHEAMVYNAIDPFILARAVLSGLQPSAEAAKEELIRRVTLDLTGLPPAIPEVDAFLADDSPEAYEKVVDRLLKSSRYGEHMARYWLDAARYGDTHGLHLDNKRQIWPYRDWLIHAFNDNLPFDKFTVWQIAGDLLPNATLEQKVATGFGRCNVTTSEGGSIAEEYRVRYAIDRVETTATVWMGLTAGCAVCHDHKFDPLSQAEFYKMYAYFYNFAEREMDGNALLPPGPLLDAPTKEQETQLASLDKQLAGLNAQIAKRRIDTTGDLAMWEANVKAGNEKLPQAPSDMSVYVPLDDGSGSEAVDLAAKNRKGKIHGNAKWASGKHGGALEFDGKTHVELGDVAGFERTDKFSYGAWIRPTNNGASTVLSRMDDAQNFRGYDMYLGSDKVFIHIIHSWDKNAIRLNTKAGLKKDEWQHVMMTYDGSSKAEGVKVFVNGKKVEMQITHNSLSGTIKTAKPLAIGRRTPGAPMQGAIDEVRIYPRLLSDAEVAIVAGANPIAEIVAIASDERTEQQTELLHEYFLSANDEAYKKLKQQVAESNGQISAIKAAIPKTMVMGDRPNKTPVYRLVRGQYDKPDKSTELQPNVPAILTSLPAGTAANRLALANWLVSRDHPLTARVTINRYWQQIFGTGIVKTTEDFGSQGEWPSHPALLDWLAVEFMESGWDLKHMMKLMVMSRTYRQSTVATPEHLARDKENRLLSRGPRFRLDAEVVRDNALFLGGLLGDKIGGPSVRPYQPDGLWKAVGYSGSNTVKFQQDHGDSLYRRSMYIFWKRTAPPPTMQIFDAPSREYCVVRRERTNTPAAALVLMNDIQFVEAARRFAERTIRDGGEATEARITWAFRAATSRTPDSDEMHVLTNIFMAANKRYDDDKEAAAKLISLGESPRDESISASELAAWTIVASTIMNLDETITKG